ncbi:MAG: DNA repair protein RecO [Ruminococcaceae bacterium]|nr:DNA repair protein RecO [Oscillospiraceae bacterium]
MEYKNIKGIIIKETRFKENDKIFTVVTDALGKINLLAKGAAKLNSKLSSLSPLALMEMDLKSLSDNMYIATGSHKLIDFFDISKDLESYAYLSYIFSLANDLFLYEDPFPDLMKLLINTVYLYSKGDKNKELLKCVFELRALTLSGYAIESEECVMCGDKDIKYINLYEGECLCKNCGGEDSGKPVSPSVLAAIRHITYSEDSKVFSFSVNGPYIKELSIITTNYIKICLEKEYSSLKYLRNIQKGLN